MMFFSFLKGISYMDVNPSIALLSRTIYAWQTLIIVWKEHIIYVEKSAFGWVLLKYSFAEITIENKASPLAWVDPSK